MFPVFSTIDILKLIVKGGVFVAIVALLIALGNTLLSLLGSVYSKIMDFLTQMAVSSTPDMLGCILHSLGIDVWMTSAFAIVFSAGAFWLMAVGSIVVFKLSLKAYDMFVKVAT